MRNNRGNTETREGGGESVPIPGADTLCRPQRAHAGADFLQDCSLWKAHAREEEVTNRHHYALAITFPSSSRAM